MDNLTDDELIKAAQGQQPGLSLVIAASVRLKRSTADLTGVVKDLKRSNERLTWVMIALTVVLVILTLMLVAQGVGLLRAGK